MVILEIITSSPSHCFFPLGRHNFGNFSLIALHIGGVYVVEKKCIHSCFYIFYISLLLQILC